MTKVRLGIIGCGGIMRAHLEHGLGKFPDVEFVGWADTNLKAAQELAAKHGGRAFDHAEKMMDATKPDGVYVMLPPFAHGPTERAVLARKMPFFVEKPIHINYAEAKQFAAQIKKLKLITSVGYMNRYRKGIQRVKKLLESQKLVMMQGGWSGGGPPNYEGIWAWWVQKDKSGGQFLEQTTHTTDLALYLGGPVEEVYAVAIKDRLPRPSFYTIEDASTVMLKFKNGATAHLYSTVCTRAHWDVQLGVWGTDLHAQFKGWEHNLEMALPQKENVTIPGEANVFALEDRAFVDALRTGKPTGILASYEDGLKTAAIAEAANRSFKSGKPVKVSDL